MVVPRDASRALGSQETCQARPAGTPHAVTCGCAEQAPTRSHAARQTIAARLCHGPHLSDRPPCPHGTSRSQHGRSHGRGRWHDSANFFYLSSPDTTPGPKLTSKNLFKARTGHPPHTHHRRHHPGEIATRCQAAVSCAENSCQTKVSCIAAAFQALSFHYHPRLARCAAGPPCRPAQKFADFSVCGGLRPWGRRSCGTFVSGVVSSLLRVRRRVKPS